MPTEIIYGINAQTIQQANLIFESITGIKLELRDNTTWGEYYRSKYSRDCIILVYENINHDDIIYDENQENSREFGFAEPDFQDQSIIMSIHDAESIPDIIIKIDSKRQYFIKLRIDVI